MALLEEPPAQSGHQRLCVAAPSVLGRRVDGSDADPGRRGAGEAGERHGPAVVLPEPEAGAFEGEARVQGPLEPCDVVIGVRERLVRERREPGEEELSVLRGGGTGVPGTRGTSRTAVSPYTPCESVTSGSRPIAAERVAAAVPTCGTFPTMPGRPGSSTTMAPRSASSADLDEGSARTRLYGSVRRAAATGAP